MTVPGRIWGTNEGEGPARGALKRIVVDEEAEGWGCLEGGGGGGCSMKSESGAGPLEGLPRRPACSAAATY